MRSSLALRLALSSLCLAFQWGCGNTPDGESEVAQASESAEAREAFTRENFVMQGLNLPGSDQSRIRDRLGNPDSVTTEIIPNRQMASVQDTLVSLFYPGIMLKVHRSGTGGELLSQAVVRSPHYLRYPSLAPGVSREGVIAAIGAPDEESDSSLVYRCVSCPAGDEPVTFLIADDTVDGIRFDFYVD